MLIGQYILQVHFRNLWKYNNFDEFFGEFQIKILNILYFKDRGIISANQTKRRQYILQILGFEIELCILE
jgi:hypothetical protein